MATYESGQLAGQCQHAQHGSSQDIMVLQVTIGLLPKPHEVTLRHLDHLHWTMGTHAIQHQLLLVALPITCHHDNWWYDGYE